MNISQVSNAKASWNILNHLFVVTGKNSKINLKLGLFRLTMKSGASFLVHSNKFKGLLSQLASINALVHEEDCVALILKSMP